MVFQEFGKCNQQVLFLDHLRPLDRMLHRNTACLLLLKQDMQDNFRRTGREILFRLMV
jgi:hypothetical protein